MKDAFYFQHDYNARNDHKTSALISDHGATGYGVYWCLIEMLHEEAEHALPLQEFFYRSTAKQTSTSVEQVLNIIQDCLNIYHLFSEKEGFFFSERVLRNINKREETREKRSIAGKISAEKRKCSTGVQQKATKERKVKEKKEDNNSIGTNVPAISFSEMFEECRKIYPGTKRGLDVELSDLAKKHKAEFSAEFFRKIYKGITLKIKTNNELERVGRFVPEWPHFKTYLYQKKWEEQTEVVRPKSTYELEPKAYSPATKAEVDALFGDVNPNFKPSKAVA